MTTTFPNPKLSGTTKASQPRWYRFYAMFSEEFAEQVVKEAKLRRGATILDPWLGAGTTTAVAASNGFRAVGVDINPVMTTIASGRCLAQRSARNAIASIERSAKSKRWPRASSDDPLLSWFGPECSKALRGWEKRIQASFSGETRSRERGFLLTALFETAWKLATGHRSKNPTWVKQPTAACRAEFATSNVTRVFLESAREKLTICRTSEKNGNPEIHVGTSKNTGLPDSFADMVLTSPPYCTRIDYAISTRIELAVLGHGNGDVSDLRDRMMGTSTIRGSGEPRMSQWGATCNDFLSKVKDHPSKSSDTIPFVVDFDERL